MEGGKSRIYNNDKWSTACLPAHWVGPHSGLMAVGQSAQCWVVLKLCQVFQDVIQTTTFERYVDQSLLKSLTILLSVFPFNPHWLGLRKDYKMWSWHILLLHCSLGSEIMLLLTAWLYSISVITIHWTTWLGSSSEIVSKTLIT
jgi:hypothetical protein